MLDSEFDQGLARLPHSRCRFDLGIKISIMRLGEIFQRYTAMPPQPYANGNDALVCHRDDPKPPAIAATVNQPGIVPKRPPAPAAH